MLELLYMNKDFIPIFKALLIPLIILVLMWIVHILNYYYHLNLHIYGVHPRNSEGLTGILFSPLIHSVKDHSHIINNSTPLIILTWTLFYFYKKIAFQILLYSWLVVGIFVWIVARDSYHIGMSGVIYSLVFYIFFSGVFRKDVRLMAVSLFVVFLYGSMVWGIFPYDWTMSFESHFFGALVGIILAIFYKNEGASFKTEKTQWEIEEEMGIEPYDFENEL